MYPNKYIEQILNAEQIENAIIRIHIESTKEHFESINDPKIKEMLSKAKNLVSIVPTYITERETLNVELAENLGVMETFEKYLDNFDDINDKRKKDLIDFGKEIITEYEMENE